MPLSPQGHKAGRDSTRHWKWDSPQESLQPIMPQELELLSSSSFGWRGDMTGFSRPEICILPLLFTCTFYLCTLLEHQKSAEARASTTLLFCSDPRQQATFINAHRDWGQDLLSYRAQIAPEWTKLRLSAVEKVCSKSCRHWDGSLEQNMIQIYILMKQC